MTVLANVYRGSRVESVHRGSIAVVDSRGTLLAFAGEPARPTCLRSAAKPFQGIPLIEYGGVEEFELTAEEIALTCASHGGEPRHVSTAAALLRKGEYDEDDLLCGAHAPFDNKAAADLRASGEEPSPLHNNCSGKHAGMLLASRVMDVAGTRYTDPDHPVQVLIRSTLADFAGVTSDQIALAVDGCSVPAFWLPLYRGALAYARLMATAWGAASAGVVERYSDSASRVVEAMTGFPDYVAGDWSITTPLMKAFGGEVLAKEGAEGVYGIALSPEIAAALGGRIKPSEDAAVGIVIKVDDGSMGRGRNPVIMRTLELLGLDPASRPELQRYREWPLRNVAGLVVGEVRSEFELELL